LAGDGDGTGALGVAGPQATAPAARVTSNNEALVQRLMTILIFPGVAIISPPANRGLQRPCRRPGAAKTARIGRKTAIAAIRVCAS
jgi:hypothetical protein